MRPYPTNGRAQRWLSIVGVSIAALLLVSCQRTRAPGSKKDATTIRKPESVRQGQRAPAAAVTIRFSNSGIEPGSVQFGYDRLQVSAVFADVDRRDMHMLSDLVGQSPTRASIVDLDACIRQQGPFESQTVGHTAVPDTYLQLLDVGNLRLTSGKRSLPLRISMVPSMFSAIRGVRYDANVDRARNWLASIQLTLHGTGGDGIAPFATSVSVPRPIRLTHLNSEPVRAGKVALKERTGDILVRWGSVDGTAELEVLIGSERKEGGDWLRCRLRDDGAFVIGSKVLGVLPDRTPDRPWLVRLVRSQSGVIDGFEGSPMLLQLVDSVRVY